MRNRIFQIGIISCAFIGGVGGILSSRAEVPQANANGSAHIIDVSAKKYEFTPSEIRVKSGSRVELKVHSVDETHGIKLDLYPEGAADKSKPGLIFDKPELNGKVEKDQDQILDFVAQQPGTYQFRCAKLCGMRHGSMKGTLVVE